VLALDTPASWHDACEGHSWNEQERMSRKPVTRIVRAVTDRLWERDRLQMQIADGLLSAIESKRRGPSHPTNSQKAAETDGSMIGSKKWTGFRSVLCPIDFSENSRLALRYAAAVAARGRAALSVVYVNDPLLIAAAAAALHDRHFARRSAQQLREFIEATLVGRGKGDVTTESRFVCGRVADEIAAVAASERTALLITALRDRRGWFGARRGSISYHVLTRAIAPVLACPPHWRPR
jgi:nucleotide-binding universal stress UspA family protein